jgi:hypothetical protein
MNARRPALAGLAILGLSLAVLTGGRLVSRARESILDRIAREVPSAAPLVQVRGPGFVASPEGVRAEPGTSSGSGGGHAVEATAPALASRPFRVRARGARTSVDVTLVGAAQKPVAVDRGVAIYRDAYAGVDALAVPGSEKLEILYLARDVPRSPLAIALDLEAHESLREEPTTHAAVVADDKGRARVRVGAPRAVDARGVTREGRYLIGDRELTIALDWSGLTLPVVIDPTFTLPFWSILDDPRVPGETVYDPTLLSRQSHVAFDTARERVVLVRPVRPRLDTDTAFLFGDATNMIDLPARAILPVPRTGSAGEPVASGAALADWSRGYDLESETWEWNGSAWSINDAARLPGLLDPALTYDGARSRVVLYGGAPQRIFCQQNGTAGPGAVAVSLDEDLYCTAPLDSATITWEYDGSTWTPNRVPSSPPPRLRPSLAWMPSIGKTVLFGGRSFLPVSQAPIDPVRVPYPESLAGGLLADTWTYDGTSWSPVPTGSPPDPREGAQLVYDAARGVLVLVGGHSAADVAPDIDRLSIWEFDGTDWSQKLVAGDPTLPRSLATRHGASAFYNSARQRTTILGGTSDILDFCTLTAAQIASAQQAAQGDAAATTALQQTGCLGGTVQDAWEWDGRFVVQTTSVVFGGVVEGAPVFAQAAGDPSWQAEGTAAGADGGAPASLVTALLPYRYDERPDHFALRTALDRAHVTDAGADPPASQAVGVDALGAGAGVSPLFAAAVHPDVVFDGVRNVATVLVPGTAAVYETNGATWTDKTPPHTPFSTGPNDFLAMTWDTTHARLVAFDPTDGSSWSYTDAQGWQALPATGSPSRWAVDPAVHAKQDVVRTVIEKGAGSEDPAFTLAEQQTPKMTFDRNRGRVVMLFAGATWEFDGAAWTSGPLPPTWSGACAAATYLQYDGVRGVSVAFGCNVPADTWQWDGSAWAGPGPTPFTALVERNQGITTNRLLQNSFDIVQPDWFAPLQLAWAHPNAVFESPTLGGVTTLDSDGTPRTWNGAAWAPGPTITTGMFCLQSLWNPSIPGPPGTTAIDIITEPFAVDTNYWLGRTQLPMCFSPPVIEDAANGHLLAFRDGPRGMLELPLAPAPAQRAWRPVQLGTQGVDPSNPAAPNGTVQVNPYPFELMAPETVRVLTQSNPSTRTGTFGTTYTQQTAPERIVQDLWWPYQIVVDSSTSRVRLVTNRGMVWELSGENVDLSVLGGPCTSQLDCGVGYCGEEGVCCNVVSCVEAGFCKTCNGATPGICMPVAAGQPEPAGRCGTGPCAGTCSGSSDFGPGPTCVFNAALACPPGPSCSGGVLAAGGHCASFGPSCLTAAADSAIMPPCPPLPGGGFDESQPCWLPTAACPGNLGCADGASCKPACATRADCSGPYAECQSGTTACAPDQASQLATQQGITPVSWTPPPVRTPSQIAAVLEEAGIPEDDAGNFILPSDSIAGIQLAYNPSIQLPVTGLAMWTDYLGACMKTQQKVDECVVSSARCQTATPWLGDPAGNDCVPEACLVVYLQTRGSGSDSVAALQTVYESGCYEGGDGGTATEAGSGDGGTGP